MKLKITKKEEKPKEVKLEIKEVKEEPKFDPSLPEKKQRQFYA